MKGKKVSISESPGKKEEAKKEEVKKADRLNTLFNSKNIH